MGTILVVKNNDEFDQGLLERLERMGKVHVATSIWTALDVVERYHVDVYAFTISENLAEADVLDFLKQATVGRSELTPFIFVANQLSMALKSKIGETAGWYHIEVPIEHARFLRMVNNAMKMASFLDNARIRLDKQGIEHAYRVKDVTRIERLTGRRINVYYYDEGRKKEREESFFFDHPLRDFPTRHGVEKHLYQVSQSWLVNESEIQKINYRDMEITLTNGVVVPTSRKFVQALTKKTPKQGEKDDES